MSKQGKAKKRTPLMARLQSEIDSGLTYERLAEKLGTTKSQAHDWAHGTHEPQLATLRDIAKRLDCDLMDLIEARAS